MVNENFDIFIIIYIMMKESIIMTASNEEEPSDNYSEIKNDNMAKCIQEFKHITINVFIVLYFIFFPIFILNSLYHKIIFFIIACLSIISAIFYIIFFNEKRKREIKILMNFIYFIFFVNNVFFLIYSISIVYYEDKFDFIKFLMYDVKNEPYINSPKQLIFLPTTICTLCFLIYFYLSSFVSFNSLYTFKMKHTIDFAMIGIFFCVNYFFLEETIKSNLIKIAILITYKIIGKNIWTKKLMVKMKNQRDKHKFYMFLFHKSFLVDDILYDAIFFLELFSVLSLHWILENTTFHPIFLVNSKPN